VTPDAGTRRRYDSPVRRRRAAETRERIIDAGAGILHDHAVWDFDSLTVRGVAERAGVNERTVYRHFASERALRDAVMTRLEEEAGVELGDLALGDVRELTAQILGYASSFPLDPRAPRDATLLATHQRLREALRAAVADAAEGWTGADQLIAAAMLDVLWSVTSYERLVADWHLDPNDAIRGATWVIGLVEAAIRSGSRPA
jgi:AcrR family transcriptional regulator